MTYTDTGLRGATGQSWRGANPRDLLRRVMNDHPGADRVALFRLFVDKLKEDEEAEYMETIIEYWFTNNYHSLLAASGTASSATSQTAAQRTAALEGTKQKLRDKIDEQAKIVLLEMMLPNGKRLADCTGQECKSIGGWLGKVARRVEPDETIGAKLTEDDLRALYEKHA